VRRSSTKEREPLPKGFGTIWTTVAVDLVGFGIVLPILPQYAEKFGASATTIGVLVASFSMAQLVCAPLWGRLSDRIGRKPVLLISLFGTAVGSLLTGVASGVAGGLALLFVGRIIDGASGASVSVAQASVADVAAPRDRARLMGLLGAAFGVGFVAGPAIGALGALVAPQVPFYIAAVISAANALVAIRRLPETSPDHRAPVVRSTSTVPVTANAVDRADDQVAARAELEAELERVGTLDGPQPGTPYESAGSSPGSSGSDPGDRPDDAGRRTDVQVIVRLIAVSFVGMIAFSGFEATFALLTDERFGLELSGTGAVFTVIGLALVAVQVGVVGRVNDRLGESNTLRAGLTSNALGLALLAVDGGWVTLVPSLLLLVLGQGLITPTLSSAVAGRAGRARGSWLGWQQSAGGLARVLGPILAGAAFQHVGVGAPYVIGAVLALLALTLVPGSPARTD
jgi:DHA1 family tetracycline resistance protein-like MFS transporter